MGTPYGWWDGGEIPAGEPFFAGEGEPPAVVRVRRQSLACAGLVNLFVRAAGCSYPSGHYRGRGLKTGTPVRGGTAAYETLFAEDYP